jgi:hypothetical protein
MRARGRCKHCCAPAARQARARPGQSQLAIYERMRNWRRYALNRAASPARLRRDKIRIDILTFLPRRATIDSARLISRTD